MMHSLAPGLLVAAPSMSDEHFERAVVFLTEVGDDGALGFTLNRPTPYRFEEVARELEVTAQPSHLQDAVIYNGGPVSPERGWLLFRDLEDRIQDDNIIEVTGDIRLGVTVDLLRQFLTAEHDLTFKFLLGYAGWAPGQLEAELAEGAWLPLEFDADFMFSTPPAKLWDAAMARFGLGPGSIMVSTVGKA